MQIIRTDCLVIGAGLAGSAYALAAAKHGLAVELLSLSEPLAANSDWAQGGIIYETAPDPSQLARDIIEASDGTSNPVAVDHLVREGPAAVKELLLDEIGVAFDRDATMRRDHFDREGIAAVVPSFVVVSRPEGRPGFTDTTPITSRARGKVTAARLDKLLAARATGADPQRLLAARLRVPEGTTFVEEQVGPGMDKPSKLHARFADAALAPPTPMTPELLAVVTMVHEEDSVVTGLCRYAEATGTSQEQAVGAMLPAVGRALRQGLLEVAGFAKAPDASALSLAEAPLAHRPSRAP